MLEHKIDFMVTLEVKEANANGDPLNGNMPLITSLRLCLTLRG